MCVLVLETVHLFGWMDYRCGGGRERVGDQIEIQIDANLWTSVEIQSHFERQATE